MLDRKPITSELDTVDDESIDVATRRVKEFAARLDAGRFRDACTPESDDDRIGLHLTQVAINMGASVRANEQVTRHAGRLAAAVDRAAGLAAGNAQQATQTAAELSRAVEEFQLVGQSLGSAETVMRQVVTATSEIVELAADISRIAELTRILSINATIESARAGAAGAGFAVVANEVKQLAQQAQSTATKVTGIVADLRDASSEAQTTVQSGARLAEGTHGVLSSADQAFRRLGEDVAEVHHTLEESSGEIAAIRDASGFVLAGSTRGKLRNDLRLLCDLADAEGGFALRPSARLEAVDQASGGTLVLDAEAIVLGSGRSLESVIDLVAERTGSHATVFVLGTRAGAPAAMVRVATSVRRTDGRRATGTAIAAAGDHGPNPVLASVLERRPFEGLAKVLGAWYLARYEPIVLDGRVVGMVFVGDG